MKTDLDQRWRSIHGIEVDDPLARAAGELAEEFSLRALDAVHLAAALAVAEPDLVVATWDRRLADAARAAGLNVAP
jgi:uncharacterized protein